MDPSATPAVAPSAVVPAGTPVLQVDDVHVEFATRRGRALVLNGVSFDVNAGETLCIVGESGCGKSMTALTMLGLVPQPPGRVAGGQVRFHGEDLLAASEARMREVRGNRISMIFQEPMTSLNPVFSVGEQIAESLRLHAGLDRAAAREQALQMLRQVGIPAPERRIDEYPHQLSGGMRQRVMIAMALACRPDILIADEPTTALDVTVQAQIFDLLRQLQAERGTAIVLITHDMGAVSEMAQRVVVMYAGRVIEQGSTEQVLSAPQHPYTRGLIAALPELGSSAAGTRQSLAEIPGVVPSLWELGSGCAFRERCPHAQPRCAAELPPMVDSAGDGHAAACWMLVPEELAAGGATTAPIPFPRSAPAVAEHSDAPVLLSVTDLKVHFPRPRRGWGGAPEVVRAVDGVSFELRRGRTLALVGESGSGKTTTALSVMRLAPITAGSVRLGTSDLSLLGDEAMRQARRRLQMIFQDPYSSLNPRQRVGDAVRAPLDLMGIGTAAERAARVDELFAAVGLRPEQQHLFPHQFSGGQRQRLNIARALATNPELVVCDEPVSALDIAIRAQILNLLARLQRELGLTYLFISHDMAVVEHLCDDIAVMYLGQIVERAPRRRFFAQPLHPYSVALMSAVPTVKGGRERAAARVRLAGDPPSPIAPPAGCRFAGRCPAAVPDCQQPQTMREVQPGHFVACHRVTMRGGEVWVPVTLPQARAA